MTHSTRFISGTLYVGWICVWSSTYRTTMSELHFFHLLCCRPTGAMHYPFKFFREIITCSPRRLRRHRGYRLLFQTIGRAVGIFKYTLNWLVGCPFCSVVRIYLMHFDIFQFGRLWGEEYMRGTLEWIHLQTISFSISRHLPFRVILFKSGSHGYFQTDNSQSHRTSATSLWQRKYAFWAGEQASSRGEPNINKPYDNTERCM